MDLLVLETHTRTKYKCSYICFNGLLCFCCFASYLILTIRSSTISTFAILAGHADCGIRCVLRTWRTAQQEKPNRPRALLKFIDMKTFVTENVSHKLYTNCFGCSNPTNLLKPTKLNDDYIFAWICQNEAVLKAGIYERLQRILYNMHEFSMCT